MPGTHFKGLHVISFHTRLLYPLRCVLYSLTLNGTLLSSKSPIYFQMHAYLYYPQHLLVRNSSTSTNCSTKHHFLLLANWFLLTSLNIPSSCTRIADKSLMLILLQVVHDFGYWYHRPSSLSLLDEELHLDCSLY